MFFRSVIKNSSIYFLGNVLNKGVSFFMLPILATLLKPSDYGFIDLIVTISSFLVIIVSLEIYQAVARFYIEEKNIKGSSTTYVSTAFIFLFFILIFVTAFSYILKGDIFQDSITDDLNKVIILVWFLITNLSRFSVNQLKWDLKVKLNLICNCLTGVLSSLGTYLLLILTEFGVFSFFLAQIFASFISMTIAIYYTKDCYRLKFDLDKLKSMLSFSSPIVFSSASVFVATYVDRLMISSMLDIEKLGLYGFSFRLASISVLFISAFQTAITPLIYKFNEDINTPRDLSKIFDFYQVVTVILFSVLLFISPFIDGLLFPKEYSGGVMLFPYMTLTMFFSGAYVFFPGMAIKKKTKVIAAISVFSAILNSILNYFLITSYDINGAVVATFISSVFQILLYIHFSRRYYFVKYSFPLLYMSFLMCLLLLFINIEVDLILRTLLNVVFLSFYLYVVFEKKYITIPSFFK